MRHHIRLELTVSRKSFCAIRVYRQIFPQFRGSRREGIWKKTYSPLSSLQQLLHTNLAVKPKVPISLESVAPRIVNRNHKSRGLETSLPTSLILKGHPERVVGSADLTRSSWSRGRESRAEPQVPQNNLVFGHDRTRLQSRASSSTVHPRLQPCWGEVRKKTKKSTLLLST